jgi:hypothetical protein
VIEFERTVLVHSRGSAPAESRPEPT